MVASKRMGSKAKRAVVYRQPNVPRPVKEKNRIIWRGRPDHLNFGPQIFYLTGNPLTGDGYTQADGYTLTQFVLEVGGNTKESMTFPKRKFQSQETLVNWLNRQSRFAARAVPDGILIKRAYGDEDIYEEANDYRAWLNRDVYGMAVVDDPNDDTGSTLYVNHPRDVPGKIIEKTDGPIYGRERIDRMAEAARQQLYDDPKDYYFDIAQWSEEKDVPFQRAVMFGYDGRRMDIGDTRRYGNYRITRVAAPADKKQSSNCMKRRPTTAKAKTSAKPKQASAKRKPAQRRR